MKIHIVLLFLCWAVSGCVTPAIAQTGSRSDQDRLLQDLLNEIKLIRQTLERTGQVQIVLSRVQMQQDRVAALSRTLVEIRNEVREIDLQFPALEDRLRELAERLQAAQDNRRQEIENEVKAVKQILSAHRQRQEELRRRETETSGTLNQEQAKLDDFERRLDAVERSLVSPSGPKEK